MTDAITKLVRKTAMVAATKLANTSSIIESSMKDEEIRTTLRKQLEMIGLSPRVAECLQESIWAAGDYIALTTGKSKERAIGEITGIIGGVKRWTR